MNAVKSTGGKSKTPIQKRTTFLCQNHKKNGNSFLTGKCLFFIYLCLKTISLRGRLHTEIVENCNFQYEHLILAAYLAF